MDDFAKLPAKEKFLYFQYTASETGMTPTIIEKDFWVCWTLKRLFHDLSCKNELIFKGGTSLSKVYKLIERFSEDIDISINKSYFGYTHEKDPKNITSSKKQNAILKSLSQDCSSFIKTEFQTELSLAIHQKLLTLKENWTLEIDESDENGQTLLFHYPSVGKSEKQSYVRQFVKIEIGARSEHWPTQTRTILPAIEEIRKNTLQNGFVEIKVLSAERTFWEKATILHKYSHYPDKKNVPERQSRHYFDFYKLLKSNIAHTARYDLDLLKRVVEHKKIYFRAAWANYSAAKKGTLKLIPNKRILNIMENDYEKMSEMFYGNKILWNEIIKEIAHFELDFNQQN